MCSFPIFTGNLEVFSVLLRRHVYLRGALPPPGTEGYFLLTDEEDRSQVIFSEQPHQLCGDQIKWETLDVPCHPTRKVVDMIPTIIFSGYLDRGVLGTLL